MRRGHLVHLVCAVAAHAPANRAARLGDFHGHSVVVVYVDEIPYKNHRVLVLYRHGRYPRVVDFF